MNKKFVALFMIFLVVMISTIPLINVMGDVEKLSIVIVNVIILFRKKDQTLMILKMNMAQNH